ncbi:MAG: alpha-galactosidase, partial [Armatimonadota bacterium]
MSSVIRILPLLAIGVLSNMLANVVQADVERISFNQTDDRVLIEANGLSLPISLLSPALTLRNDVSPSSKPSFVKGILDDGEVVEASYDPVPIENSQLEMKLFLKWSPKESILRKWVSFRLKGGKAPILLKDVLLDDIDLGNRKVWTHGGRVGSKTYNVTNYIQSRPVFVEGFYAGIEFPISVTRHENGHLLVEHKPGIWLQPGKWYESRKAIYGTASVGHERQAFEYYILMHHKNSKNFHINYNSWYTSPVPYTEKDILELISAFDKNLYKQNGVSLDTFCIDLGWSKLQSMWEIDKNLFPDGFTNIEAAAKKMNSNIGLWVSPCSGYPEALDNKWLGQQGYETITVPINGTDWTFACLGGKKYADAFRDRLVEMVTRYGVRHIKFDANNIFCSATDHGHAPDLLSAEAIAEGLINAFKGVRKAAHDAWLEPTCFGNDGSPWWLFYVDSVMGSVGADVPIGRIPSPVYRDSYTSSRDFYNLMGAELVPIPTKGLEILGLVHQTQDDFMNDGVMTMMRGHMFIPMYLNPKYMNDARWQSLAALLKWARANAGTLQKTVPLIPASWQSGEMPLLIDTQPIPREPYGYAHLSGNRGMVVLRNPWAAPQSYILKLDETVGLSVSASRMSAVSIYPELRLYGKDLHFGDKLDVHLAPYETVVLSIGLRNKQQQNLSDVGKSYLKVSDLKQTLSRVKFDISEPVTGPNWTYTLGDVSSALQMNLEGTVEVASPQASLLLFLEGATSPATPLYTIKVNGQSVMAEVNASITGWYAGNPTTDHWTLLRVPLMKGSSNISVDLMAGNDCTKVSAWVW